MTPAAADPASLFAERAAFVPGSTIAWGMLRDGETVTGSTNPLGDPRRYQIGSVTKLFTGSLLASFVRRGIVRLDTRIGDVIDTPVADAVGDVTLLQLATHTAGLPRLPPDMRAENGSDPYANFNRDALFGFVAKQQTGAIVDGRGSFDYSNFGVSVLGEVLAVAAGRSYPDLLDDEIFVPLGMRDAFVATAEPPEDVPDGMNADGERMPPWHFDAFAPAGGVVASAADLLTFARAICENRTPLVDALRDALLPRAPVREGGGVGLCWMCEDTLRWHNGQTFGHHAMLALDVAAERAAVAVWNAAASLDDICFHLIRPSRELALMPVEEPLTLQSLSRYAGTYEKEYPKGATFWIAADERGLTLNDATHFRLYSESPERFFAKQIPGVDFTFVLDADGEATGLEQTVSGVPGIPAMMRAPAPALNVRIGIDVGGTFTDVVAVDAATRALLASVKVPTTHAHADGVAAGIVAGLERLLREAAIDPQSVAFIAHSTTQATNALLEGDVAAVGVACFGPALTRAAMHFAPVPLAAGGSALAPRFFAAGADLDGTLDAMASAGVEAVVASAAFGVDRPAREQAFVERARERGFAATSGSEVSTMYGLRARTRTAALNAAILPRMLRTSRVTLRAVADARIPAPLMIMRSDGGVMDVAEVERRPILTMLSGPAAGIAGALFHENVTDGIFIEVGGTSADCSVIRRGRPQVRPARIGGHRTLLRTLDVRTLGVAGGSLVLLARGAVSAVGPRSAHIAGYRYATFCNVATVAAAEPTLAGGYASFASPEGPIAITPTCAANVLGVVPADAFAHGDAAAARLACERVGAALGLDAEGFARAVLERATAQVRPTLDALIAEYELDRTTVELVGGGGGAAALVPYVAAALGLHHRLARNAEVISPLGVALALVRDVVERTIVDPSSDDLARIRREAVDAAIRSGAAPERIEVTLDVDRARNLVRAVASGATALVEGAATLAIAGDDQRLAAAARALHASAAAIAVRTPRFIVVAGERALAVVDERAVVRLVASRGVAFATTAGALARTLAAAIEDYTAYGDVGRAPPDLWLLVGARAIELVGIADAEAAAALAGDEIAGLPEDEPLAVVAIPQRA